MHSCAAFDDDKALGVDDDALGADVEALGVARDVGLLGRDDGGWLVLDHDSTVVVLRKWREARALATSGVGTLVSGAIASLGTPTGTTSLLVSGTPARTTVRMRSSMCSMVR